MQLAFYFDQTRCTACRTCVVACKDWNGVAPGPAAWLRLSIEEQGVFPNVSVFNMINACYHCKKPACVAACPEQAIFKRSEDGIVVADRSKCLEVRACQVACPYGAPQFGDDLSEPEMAPGWLTEHPIQKCTFCWDRWAAGRKPACVESCIMRALDAGPEEEIIARYPGAVKAAVGFPDGDTEPVIYFNPKALGTPTVGST